jgi:hypothetical protein
MKKKPTQSKPFRAKQARGEGLLSTALLALLEATAYDLWMCALRANNTRGLELYQRMKNPEIGDQVMEISTYRRIKKNRRGFGKLIEKQVGENEYQTKWTIETPDGQICDWRNASIIAIPAGSFEWYPSLANV